MPTTEAALQAKLNDKRASLTTRPADTGTRDIAEVKLPTRAVRVASAWTSAGAIDDEGHVWEWGYGSPEVTQVAGLGQVVDIIFSTRALDGTLRFALTKDGVLWMWGKGGKLSKFGEGIKVPE